MGEYTFTVEKKCPACGEMTRLTKTKSRLISVSTDEDGCMHYRDFNPYLYKAWVCEKCGFATDEKNFSKPLTNRDRDKVNDFLAERKVSIEYAEERDVAAAERAYKLAMFFAGFLGRSLAHQAGWCLQLAWVYRYAGDKEKENDMLRKAAELYDKSVMTEDYPIGHMSDWLAMYVISAIYMRCGDMEKSTQYLSRLMSDKDLRTRDVKLFEKVRDLWQTIREQKSGTGDKP